METKRYISNDIARLYRKVKRELGPDAVIVRTRTLHRPGAAPLVEVLAAPSAGPDALPLDIQRTILDETLAAAERPRLTVADLEDLLQQPPSGRIPPEMAFSRPHEDLPEWLDGFVDGAPAAPVVTLHQEPDVPPKPARGGMQEVLLAAGLSPRAVGMIVEHAPRDADAVRAVAAALARPVRYPAEGETAIITMQGPPAAGRTTALLRMAIDCADAGRQAVLVAADSTRAGSRDQVHATAAAAGLQSTEAYGSNDLELLADRADAGTCLFVDVPPGHWRASPALSAAHYAYRVVPAHWQEAALRAAGPAPSSAAYAGSVLTFTDLGTNLSPALSLVVELATGIAFLSCNRDVSRGISVAEPLTLASGLLGTTTGETADGRLAAIA